MAIGVVIEDNDDLIPVDVILLDPAVWVIIDHGNGEVEIRLL